MFFFFTRDLLETSITACALAGEGLLGPFGQNYFPIDTSAAHNVPPGVITFIISPGAERSH